MTDQIDDNTKQAKIIYILYLASLVFGVTSIVGLVMAYLGRGEASELAANHYRWQIRTFWICLLYSFVGLVLSLIVIGFFVLLAVAVLFIVRCVMGLMALDKGQPVQNVESWLW